MEVAWALAMVVALANLALFRISLPAHTPFFAAFGLLFIIFMSYLSFRMCCRNLCFFLCCVRTNLTEIP